ncbi:MULTISPECIES: hypothetical protein [Streptomyces]|uniref:hypothetical protein n=1 Tax=Streptomyces TaxID=1883 RepID=UPI001E2DE8F9|nr:MULTISPECIES: hypothetical protein [Streptomyces]UFQ16459.1 hypothetical protein J2N69_16400 [Streptomyces huasconensis]WCL86061.1 hypothetical protein PPN52_16410 [Streptomyces sp. JCM 35825]
MTGAEVQLPASLDNLRDIASTFGRLGRSRVLESHLEQATRNAGPAMVAELRARGLWGDLCGADKAAVLWAAADSAELDLESPEGRAKLPELARTVEFVALLCGVAPPFTTEDRTTGLQFTRQLVARLKALPAGWREEVLRRVVMGDVGLHQAVNSAEEALMVLRTRWNIDWSIDVPAA